MCVGGKLINITEKDNLVKLTVKDNNDICNVNISKEDISWKNIKLSDSIWWQAGKVYWSSKDFNTSDYEFKKIGVSYS